MTNTSRMFEIHFKTSENRTFFNKAMAFDWIQTIGFRDDYPWENAKYIIDDISKNTDFNFYIERSNNIIKQCPNIFDYPYHLILLVIILILILLNLVCTMIYSKRRVQHKNEQDPASSKLLPL